MVDYKNMHTRICVCFIQGQSLVYFTKTCNLFRHQNLCPTFPEEETTRHQPPAPPPRAGAPSRRGKAQLHQVRKVENRIP